MQTKRPARSFFTRPRLGLALSGGGARGLAHIGVLKVLEREGIKISAIAGTSMGGLVGAAYCAGVSPQALEQEAIRMSQLRELVRLIDWFPPKGKLLDATRVRQFLRDRLHLDIDFSDLKIPLTVMTVDLQTNQPRPISSGSVLKGVEATTALPGLFTAVEHQGSRLIDGSVLNNLPVDQLTTLGANTSIAVDVGFQLADQHPERQIPILRSLPKVATEFYQVGAMMVAEITKQRLAASPPNLLLKPDLPAGIGILSGFTRPQEIIDRGEQATQRSLDQIQDVVRPSLQSWFQSLRSSQVH